MAKFCEKCGAPLKEGGQFCTGCGAKIEQPAQPVAEQKPVQNQPMQQPTQTYQQPSNPTPTYPQPKKSKGLLIAIIAIIAIVLVVVVVLFVFQGGMFGGGGSIVGTWEYEAYGMSMSYKFNSDKSLDIEYMGYTTNAGTWETNGNQLCIDYLGSYGSSDMCYDYSISGNQMTLSYEGIEAMKLTKV